MKKLVVLVWVALCITLPTLAQKKAEEKILIPFRKGNLWGFADEKKKIRIKPIFEKVTPFRQADRWETNSPYTAQGWLKGEEMVIAEDGSYIAKSALNNGNYEFDNYRDDMKEVAMESDRDNTCTEKPFADASMSFADGKHGFFAKENPKFIGFTEARYAPVYSEFIKAVEDYKYAIVRLKENQKLGVIDTKGNIMVPFEYDEIGYASSKKRFEVRRDYLRGLLDLQGKDVLPVVYTNIYYMYWVELFIVAKDGKSGIVDDKNQATVPFDYDDLKIEQTDYKDVKKNYFAATKNGRQGIIDAQNNVILPFEYSYIEETSYRFSDIDKLYLLKKMDEKYNSWQGLYDMEARRVVLDCKYATIYEYKKYKSKRLAFVKDANGIEFYVDETGTEYYEK